MRPKLLSAQTDNAAPALAAVAGIQPGIGAGRERAPDQRMGAISRIWQYV